MVRVFIYETDLFSLLLKLPIIRYELSAYLISKVGSFFHDLS